MNLRVASKILIPQLVLTQIADLSDDGAVRVSLPKSNELGCYYVSPLVSGLLSQAESRLDERIFAPLNLFPVVLDSNGVPWAEAVVYLVTRFIDVNSPVSRTYGLIADDLAAYRRFLDDAGMNWLGFPLCQNSCRLLELEV